MATRGVFDDVFFQGTDFLQDAQYGTTAVASGSLLASQTFGASDVYLLTSGATALTLPAATVVVAQAALILTQSGAATPLNLMLNLAYRLRVLNSNGGTLTLTAGTGNTITGTATLATNTYRDYVVTITSPATVTYQNVGSGSI